MAGHFGRWLKEEIENLGIPQTEFSERTGIARQTLTTWLGASRPNIRGHNLVRIARGLGKERSEVEARLREAWADNPDADATGAEPLEWEDLAAFRRVPIVNLTTNYDQLLRDALGAYYRDGTVIAPVADLPAFAVVADTKGGYRAGLGDWSLSGGDTKLLVFTDADPRTGSPSYHRPHAILLEGQADADFTVSWIKSDPKDAERFLAVPLGEDPFKGKPRPIPREKIRRLGRWLATFSVS